MGATAWVIGGVLAAVVVGGTAAALARGQQPGGCPSGDVLANSDGSCPAGYVADPSSPGCCMLAASNCLPGSQPCPPDCPPEQICLGGCCGTPIPSQLQVLSNPGIAQDETVGTFFGYCDWSSLAFYPWGSSPATTTVTVRVTDAGGNPVPDLVLLPHFQSGALAVYESGGTRTAANGTANFHIYFAGPYQSGNCPISPGLTANQPAVDTLDIYLENGTVFGSSIVCTGTAYVVGV